MQTVIDFELPAPAEQVWPHIVELDRYPTWMRLVHAVKPSASASPPDGADEHPSWDVELRARVGPFARSKRLRMVRTESVTHDRVRFEREELDGRNHAAWVLTASLSPASVGTLLTMDLYYGGRLWTAGVLDRVLEQEIQRGKSALLEQVSGPSAAH